MAASNREFRTLQSVASANISACNVPKYTIDSTFWESVHISHLSNTGKCAKIRTSFYVAPVQQIPKPAKTFVFSKCYLMDCFGTYILHTGDDGRVRSATQWTASVHTSHKLF